MQCPFCKEEVMAGAVKCKHCGSMIPPVSVPRETAGVDDFGVLFGRAVEIWKGNLGDLVLLTLVFMRVVWVPIANIGFIAGYTRSLLKVARGKGKAQVGDIFGAWDCFGNLFVYVLIVLIVSIVLHLVPIFGSLASIVLGFVVVPGGYLIIDRGAGALDACKWSLETIRADFLNWLLAYLVGNVIACAGLVLLMVGVLLTAPLGQLIIIRQYERARIPSS